MDNKFEYLSGLPEVGIVRARRTCRASPPAALRARARPRRLQRKGGAHLPPLSTDPTGCPARPSTSRAGPPPLGVPAASRSAAFITCSATAPAGRRATSIAAWRGSSPTRRATMNVTAPRVAMDHFFEHHSATMSLLHPRGRGIARDHVRADRSTSKGDFLILPKGALHRFVLAPGPAVLLDVRDLRGGSARRRETASTGRFITHSESDYKFPRSLDDVQRGRTLRGHLEDRPEYMRRVHPTHPLDVVGWRGDYLPYQLRGGGRAAARGRPLPCAALRPHRSSRSRAATSASSPCARWSARHVAAVLSPNLDYLETLGYHLGDFFSGGGAIQAGMVTLHPVGLPHGPQAGGRSKTFMEGRRQRDQARGRDHGGLRQTRPRSRSSRSGSAQPDYMGQPGRATPPIRASRTARRASPRCERRRTRWSAARDDLRPTVGDDEGGS